MFIEIKSLLNDAKSLLNEIKSLLKDAKSQFIEIKSPLNEIKSLLNEIKSLLKKAKTPLNEIKSLLKKAKSNLFKYILRYFIKIITFVINELMLEISYLTILRIKLCFIVANLPSVPNLRKVEKKKRRLFRCQTLSKCRTSSLCEKERAKKTPDEVFVGRFYDIGNADLRSLRSFAR